MCWRVTPWSGRAALRMKCVVGSCFAHKHRYYSWSFTQTRWTQWSNYTGDGRTENHTAWQTLAMQEATTRGRECFWGPDAGHKATQVETGTMGWAAWQQLWSWRRGCLCLNHGGDPAPSHCWEMSPGARVGRCMGKGKKKGEDKAERHREKNCPIV